ncbi:MAG TPA: M28 family peptidase [Bacteriovoracaceae bacterium]|nr:M28 family peptidase [Bacteriovoracaceae bacterium]
MFSKKSLVALGLLGLSSLNASAAQLSIDCILRGYCISTQNVVEHLKALQGIADANNGNRSAGSSGHELSANYVAQQLLAAGFKVELAPFSFMKFSKLSAAFSQAAPAEVSYAEEKDFQVMNYSGSGSVTAALVAVDVQLGVGNASTSGCEKEDFATFIPGTVALIQRGTCAFQQKVENAQAAGAAGVVLFNQGNTADRSEIFSGTLSEGSAVTIPVFATSYPFATALIEQGAVTVKLAASTKVESKISYNVLAETKDGNPDNIVMVGAHLDSVAEGPGINDNGSGSAAILEVALNMKNTKVTNKVRFAWFSAEELGLVGSNKYVESLSEAQKSKISLYLNIDMVGSPNYMLSVYDGDGSKFGQKGPEGSAAIEKKLHTFFSEMGSSSVESELNGRSDYAAFSAAGIAVGGLFTGAEGKKSEEEAKLFGGAAGEAYDACYHKACDGLTNVNTEALELNTNAVAYLTLSFANSAAEVRPLEKSMSRKARNKVVFPKHLHCHEDVFDI